ncbi:MAG: nucleotidyltransferase family protein [Alphaproteobacteria bacterium]
MAAPPNDRNLTATLELLLPDETDSRLLQACLVEPPASAVAWTSWTQMVGDPKQTLEQDRRGLKGLLPLIYLAVDKHGFSVPDGFRTYLRAGSFREELRWNAIENILGQIVQIFEKRGIAFTIVGGVAAALTVYDRPEHRHCHQLSLLVGDAISDASDALAEAGFKRDRQRVRRRTRPCFSVLHHHHDGLPVLLMSDLSGHPCHAAAGTIEKPVSVESIGRTVPVTTPTDQLVTIMAQAATSRTRLNLRWVCDIWKTLDSSGEVDWERFQSEVGERRLALPGAVMFRYLADKLDAPIPAPALSALEARAQQATSIEREAALAGALLGLTSTCRFLAAADWFTRMEAARYLLAPSQARLDWEYGHDPKWRRLLRYIERPTRYGLSRLLRMAKPESRGA